MKNVCKRCHRVLKNPMSVDHGYGPVCWIKVQKDIEQNPEQCKDNVYMTVKQ